MRCNAFGSGQNRLGHEPHPIVDVVDRQPTVESQKLPAVDVGGDDEDIDQPGTRGGLLG